MRLNTDIFLITYPKDYPWLPYLFKSMNKYARGFGRLCLVVEEGDSPPTSELKELSSVEWYVETCRRYRGTSYPGNLGQTLEKMRAWHYTDAERIFFIDADCAFIRPFDVQTDPAVNIEKPLIIHTPWSKAGDARCWREPTKTVLGFDPPAETMRRFPFCYPSWFMHKVWEDVGGEERLSRLTVPEFNVLGNYAMVKQRDAFTFTETLLPTGNESRADSNIEGLPLAPIRQFWSHGGITMAVKAELERITG